MSNRKSTSKRRFPFLMGLAALAALGVILAGSGFAFAASQETHDSFCASCHTQPESTFYQRSTNAQATDLASIHTTYATRCIDCHSGPGVAGRLQAELMGARNASAWFLRLATQPAPLTVPIQNANCLKCHADVTERGFVAKESLTVPSAGGGEGGETGRPNHWHTFLARWQTADPKAAGCSNCHASHSTGNSAETGFADTVAVSRACEACHRVIGRD